jgi:hypothetical protein
MFVPLSNNTFPLFINNIFQSFKIILKYFCVLMRVYLCSHVRMCIGTSFLRIQSNISTTHINQST